MVTRTKMCFAIALAVLISAASAAEPVKILQVNSYSSDWSWVQDQSDGFREALGIPDAIFRTVDLNEKAAQPAEVAAKVEEVKALISSFKPDLLYVTDDPAQSAVAKYFLNTKLRIVFSGVNKEPADYGYNLASNVTGALEREHFLPTLRLLKEILKIDRVRVAFIIDDDPTWIGVKAHLLAEAKTDAGLSVISWIQPKTYEEFKNACLGLKGKVDAIGMLGVFRFLGSDGKFTDYETVLRWVAENSKIPDFSFWESRIERGTLCSVNVSGFEQGKIAGDSARAILLSNTIPSTIPSLPSSKGVPSISLARAKALGLRIDASILLNSKVFTHYSWNEQ